MITSNTIEESTVELRKIAARNMQSGIAEYYSAWQDGMRVRSIKNNGPIKEDTDNGDGGKDDDDDTEK